jgi:predicted metal-binding membrane protein
MTQPMRTRGVPALRAWTRFELVLAGVLLAAAAGAWALTGATSMPDMQGGILTGLQPMATTPATPGMPGMPGMEPSAGASPALAAALFMATWVVMMAAMMLPAITPFTIGLARLLGEHPHRRRRLAALTAGYLAVWGMAGLAALGVVKGFDALAADPTPTTVRTGAAVLLLAGAYQFTPLKRWCLVRCRSPLALVMRHGPRATRSEVGALATGLTHGAYCLGCCWALMLVLLAAGVMNLVWMAVIAAVITVEKVLPRGEVLAQAIGALLLTVGVLLLTAPELAAAG